ncbi:MAG: hypothetical protein U1D55_09660 [Phycisphaerae bacterium]
MESQFRSFALIGVLALVCTAQADDRDIIARAASEWQIQGQTAQSADSGAANDAERRARVDVAVSTARLELILARKALRAGRTAEAARHAQTALGALKPLGDGADVSELELQAEGVLARAARGGVAAGEMQPADPPPGKMTELAPPAAGATPTVGPSAIRDPRDASSAAARLSRQYSGADTPDVDTRGRAEILQQRAALQAGEDSGYRPGRAIIDSDSLAEQDRQRLAYEGALRHAYQSDEARRLMQADEARIAPEGEISYPDNWPDIVAKRAGNKDGAIARSDTWTDKDGRQWYVAVYDVNDITYLPPDFAPPADVGFIESFQTQLDRDALRYRSEIFGGYPEDLAAGIPLLRYFGGVDPYAMRGPKYSAERQQQIVDMIRRFTQAGSQEPRIDSIGP